MQIIHYWIQIENHAWDVCPHNVDRMTGESIKDRTGKDAVKKTLFSPVTLHTRKDVTIYLPAQGTLSQDALILRRYTENWAAPDDRKVNPWDLNEPHPTDEGTMGTIPGPVIECNVGDKVIVHFRNKDHRTMTVSPAPGKFLQVELPVAQRTHSLHPHGFAFAPTSDGAYPLSPPDPDQPVAGGPPPGGGLPAPDESAIWSATGSASGFTGTSKQGDRVPPDCTYQYTWIAGAPSEANPNEIEPWPTTAGVWLYHDHSIFDMDNVKEGAIGIIVIHNTSDIENDVDIRDPNDPSKLDPAFLPGGLPNGSLTVQRKVPPGAPPKEVYRTPPSKAQYLLLLHELGDAKMCINGRKYLGNTPTLIAGAPKPVADDLVGTLMRFGVIGMGDDFHTFHLHGHRWTIPGPDGANRDTIQKNPQVTAISQFEDTRIFGPANSFVFTILEGSFSGAIEIAAVGEWHMHCHVLAHMEDGMMGSLLVINGGEAVKKLPVGVPTEIKTGGGGPGVTIVQVQDDSFSPQTVTIKVGETVSWVWEGVHPHSTTADNGAWDSTVQTKPFTYNHTFQSGDPGVPGTFPYYCKKHGSPGPMGAGMRGSVIVTP
jgi:plastocyanin